MLSEMGQTQKAKECAGNRGAQGKGMLLGTGTVLGQGYWGLYLFKELIHKVVSIHVDHLLFIIAVFCLGNKARPDP